MLSSLHVKNLALIDEEEIVFSDGLNILSGETGAGKSIILGALGLSLGDKASKDILRDSSQEALVETVFLVKDENTKMLLQELDVETFDDEVIFTRKITENRTVGKINGEQVPAAKMKQVGDVLLDIYGQKEHQSLLNKSKHLELLDEFSKNEIGLLKDEIRASNAVYSKLVKELESAKKLDTDRDREIILLDYEINEIQSANLKIGEDDILEAEYKRLSNYGKTVEYLNRAYDALASNGGASDNISRAISEIRCIENSDEKACEFLSILNDADIIISDLNREISSYLSDSSFDEKEFSQIESRLNEINRLKDKYGMTIPLIMEALEERLNQRDKFNSFDQYLSELKNNVCEEKKKLERLCIKLSEIRKKNAVKLSDLMQAAMADLNFLNSEFSIEFSQLNKFTDVGFDDVQFMISTNPGEPVRPLKDIASGGEMSRIMLAMKTVLAARDEINTLIFDEIDTGISGRTAQAVSEKLALVARDHQVICITHLPQIAAMADNHFLIEKNIENGHTISGIKDLSADEIVLELARMLGGSEITDTVKTNALEMKSLASKYKEKLF